MLEVFAGQTLRLTPTALGPTTENVLLQFGTAILIQAPTIPDVKHSVSPFATRFVTRAGKAEKRYAIQ